MKKYLLSALALPLLFACSSEDYLDQKATDNDQFAGIEKVDATFSMAEGTMRMAKDWDLEEGDKYGFAWLGDGTNVSIDGKAYQNHPLTQKGSIFKPQTSIYVGKYFLYRPYDETVVSPEAIHFKSLEEQTIVDGRKEGWAPLAKNAIIIGDKWTDVSKDGKDFDGDGEKWNQAGIDHKFKIYAAVFSNQTGLDLKYEKNNVEFDGTKTISGATDITFKPAAGTKVGAADIYGGTVKLDGAAKSFTYAPTAEPNTGIYPQMVDDKKVYHDGTFWANKKNLVASGYEGFTFADGTDDVITLNVDKNAYENGISTDNAKNKGWFWFNSLPVTTGNATKDTPVKTVLNTSYGTVTINSTVGDCAWANESYDGTSAFEWIKLADATSDAATPKTWDVSSKNTFVNQYGNHAGKFALDVDFSKGVMNGMHIQNDKHLQKALKYYIASGKDEDVVLNLDKGEDGNFEISKISIALLQTINATTEKVKVQACTVAEEKPNKIIVTQDGQAELGLAAKKEVPALNKVFAVATDVYLAKCDWTWSGGGEAAGWDDALTIDDKVKSITNEGTITVDAKNIQLSLSGVFLYNASDATMNINKVTTVKNSLNNFGVINVGDKDNNKAELRAYGAKIYNNATELDARGVINNYGVVGSTSGTSGEFHNWGLINMMNDDAMTLLKSNEKGTDPFCKAFNKTSNKMGTVVLPKNNPTAIVSVANKAENGFIKYTWPATETTYATPAGNVKYNTIVVSDDITFTDDEDEIQYIEFTGTKTQVVNPTGNLTQLKGIIVDNEDHNASIIIEKTNEINCKIGAYLGDGATVYKGGTFTLNGGAFGPGTVTNYLGPWSTDQIVVWGE